MNKIMIINGRKIQRTKVHNNATNVRIQEIIPAITINKRIKKPTILINTLTINVSKKALKSKPPLYVSFNFCQGLNNVLRSTDIEKK